MGKILVKDDVQPELIRLVAAVANLAQEMPIDIMITAGIDGVHLRDSYHYALRAIDLRTHNFPDQAAIKVFSDKLLATHGPGHQILHESIGTPNEHLHVQFSRIG